MIRLIPDHPSVEPCAVLKMPKFGKVVAWSPPRVPRAFENKEMVEAVDQCLGLKSTVEPRVTYPERRLFGRAASSLF